MMVHTSRAGRQWADGERKNSPECKYIEVADYLSNNTKFGVYIKSGEKEIKEAIESDVTTAGIEEE